MPQVPSRSNRRDPAEVYPEAYRERGRVERLFDEAEPFRRVATRYEKRRRVLLGAVHLVLGFIRLRKLANVNRT